MTPIWAVDALLRHIIFRSGDRILEPCRGTGNIYNRLPRRHIKRYWREIDDGRDYLKYHPRRRFDFIITNPPFSLALDFLKKSLNEANTVCYLLRLNYLGSEKRQPFWMNHPPTDIIILSRRPSFTGGGTDATEYAWFIWDTADRIIGGHPANLMFEPCKGSE